MSRPFFAGEIFQGMGNFADGFDVSEVAEESRKQEAMNNAAIAANNSRTSSAAMLGQAEIEAAEYSTDQGGFFENALPGIIQGAAGFAGAVMPSGGFAATEGVNPKTVVNKVGGSASNQAGNDFYVDAGGNIFANPT